MARGITKTNPIGVRFDKDLLEGLNLGGIANSPQKALNLYEKSYIELVELKTKVVDSVEVVNVIDELVNKESQKADEPAIEQPKKLSMKERIALEMQQFLNSKNK